MSNPVVDLPDGRVPPSKPRRRGLTVLDSEARALNLGAEDYLAKPAPRAKLSSRVRRARRPGQPMKRGH